MYGLGTLVQHSIPPLVGLGVQISINAMKNEKPDWQYNNNYDSDGLHGRPQGYEWKEVWEGHAQRSPSELKV